MPHLNHTAFVNACRDERGVGHHTLRAYHRQSGAHSPAFPRRDEEVPDPAGAALRATGC